MQNSTPRPYKRLKLSTLTAAIGAASLGALGTIEQASAFTAYEDANNLFIINGRIAGNYSWNRGGVDGRDNFRNQGSRINLVYEHRFDGDWTALARTEWGFDPFFDDGSDNHAKRLQYVGVRHPVYGTVLAGQQWSLYYDLVGSLTDTYWTNFSGNAQGSFNGNQGSEFQGLNRPNQAISYRNTWNDLTWALQYGTSTGDTGSTLIGINSTSGAPEYTTLGGERKYFAQTALSWQANQDLTLAAAYNYSRIDQYYPVLDNNQRITGSQGETPNINAWLLGVSWTPGNWYLAATAGEQRNVAEQRSNAYHSARGYESIVRYTFADLFEFGDAQLYGGFNRYEDQASPARKSGYLLGTALLAFDKQLILALEHRFNDDKDTKGRNPTDNNEDTTAVLVRYNY